MAMTTTSLADAKNRLSEIVKTAEMTHERTTITKNGRPVAVVLSVEDLESIEETLEIMSDPELMASIRQSQAEMDSGKFVTEAEMTKIMTQRLSSQHTEHAA